MAPPPNPFAKYRGQRDAWLDVLARSIDEPVIDDLAFPRFPPAALQERVHGHSGRHSLVEAFAFFDAIQRHTGEFNPDGRLLDFGSGWGRIVRPFMPHFSLKKIVGLEPNAEFCRMARALNPYVCFIESNAAPPVVLAAKSFDYVVSWSVFSHLPEDLARAWFAEIARICRPGATIAVTTWGPRFLHRLANAEESHWYVADVRSRAGDIEAVSAAYEAGEFIWIRARDDYGETLIPDAAMARLLPPTLQIAAVDHETLPQSMFILKRIQPDA